MSLSIVDGTLAFDAALRLLKQMVDTAAEKQVIGILLNGLAMDGTLSILDGYRVAVEAGRSLQSVRSMVTRMHSMPSLRVGKIGRYVTYRRSSAST